VLRLQLSTEGIFDCLRPGGFFHCLLLHDGGFLMVKNPTSGEDLPDVVRCAAVKGCQSTPAASFSASSQ
jgi:hypothetical protein